ncbi:MAG: hypothetical protein AAAC47_15065, partial [Pararhizobium sp.]
MSTGFVIWCLWRSWPPKAFVPKACLKRHVRQHVPEKKPPRLYEGYVMIDVASFGANIQKSVLEATSDALGLAILVCDKNDEIIFASRPILQFYP